MKKRKSFIISLAVAGAVFMSGGGLAAEAEKYAQINGIKFVDLDAEAEVKPTAAPSPSVTADNKVNSSPNTGDRGISGLITACMSAGLVSVLTFFKKKKLKCEDE